MKTNYITKGIKSKQKQRTYFSDVFPSHSVNLVKVLINLRQLLVVLHQVAVAHGRPVVIYVIFHFLSNMIFDL